MHGAIFRGVFRDERYTPQGSTEVLKMHGAIFRGMFRDERYTPQGSTKVLKMHGAIFRGMPRDAYSQKLLHSIVCISTIYGG